MKAVFALHGSKHDLIPVHAFLEQWNNNCEYIETPTSGTTSKGTLLRIKKSHMINSATATGRYFHFASGQNMLLCMNPEYIAGKMMIVRALVFQMNLYVVAPSLHPLETISIPLHFVAMTPAQMMNTINTPQLKHVNTLLLGGSSVPARLEASLQDCPAACYHSFGMTETTSHIALRRINGKSASFIYQCIEGVTLGIDEHNCLIIHAPQLADITIYTRDVVEIISPTSFKWLGRYDYIINTGGIKVNPEEVEAEIASLLSVRYYIVGVPHEQWGQEVVLVVESIVWTAEEQQLLLNQIHKIVKKYAAPKKIIFVEHLDETPTGKIKRTSTF